MSEQLISGVPQFGNPQHIKIVRTEEARAEFAKVKPCRKCEGDKKCFHCDSECEDCGGTGKDYMEVEKFRADHPGIDLWRLVR